MPEPDRVRVAEALRLSDRLSGSLWPGWERTPFRLLLVTDSVELFLGHRDLPGDFALQTYDSLLRREIWARPRQLSPTLLATFPLDGAPTVIVGSAERSGRHSVPWVLTLLHEHFHQWQYARPDYYARVARLDLAKGDTTGMWMLNYPFPYDSRPVIEATRRLSSSLVSALDSDSSGRQHALRAVVRARNALRRHLSDADYRYFEFQLWQEGVARFMEYAAARGATQLAPPSAEFQKLPDYESYEAVADRIRQGLRSELQQLDLAGQRRVAFYPLGAAMALLLDQSSPDWKREYARRPFVLAALLAPP
jgi:hypothetical protein